jgi:hypothetical protein
MYVTNATPARAKNGRMTRQINVVKHPHAPL